MPRIDYSPFPLKGIETHSPSILPSQEENDSLMEPNFALDTEEFARRGKSEALRIRARMFGNGNSPAEPSSGFSYPLQYHSDSDDYGGRGTPTPPPDPHADPILNTEGLHIFDELKTVKAKKVGFKNDESTCLISHLPLNKETDRVVVLKESTNSKRYSAGFYNFENLLHMINTAVDADDVPKHPITGVTLYRGNLYSLAVRVV